MADIPDDDDVKKAAAAAGQNMWTHFTNQVMAGQQPDGFAKDEAASSRDSLVVDSPAEAVPSAMDTEALSRARAERTDAVMEENASRYTQQKSVWEEQLEKTPTPQPEARPEPDQDLDR